PPPSAPAPPPPPPPPPASGGGIPTAGGKSLGSASQGQPAPQQGSGYGASYMMDASSYTLTNGSSSGLPSSGGGRSRGNSSANVLGGFGAGGGGGGGGAAGGRPEPVEDRRWKFQDDSQLPMPRPLMGGAKRYRAGRGSSVPLDVGAFG
ncbi:hypothetical protein KC346_g23141, partial [Hortaea werneckii]